MQDIKNDAKKAVLAQLNAQLARTSTMRSMQNAQNANRKKGVAGATAEDEQENDPSYMGVEAFGEEEKLASKPDTDNEVETSPETEAQQQQAADKEFKEQLFTVYAAQEVSESRQLESEESITAAKAFVFDTDQVTQNSPISQAQTKHADVFTSIVQAGREQALCFVYEVTGDAEMIHQTYTGAPDSEAFASVPNNLGPIEFGVVGRESRKIGDYVTEEIVGIAQIAQSRIEEKMMEAGLDMPLAEFPLSLSRITTTAVTNLVKQVGKEAKPQITAKLHSRGLLENAEKEPHLVGFLGLAA